jgi:hypothetical protein
MNRSRVEGPQEKIIGYLLHVSATFAAIFMKVHYKMHFHQYGVYNTLSYNCYVHLLVLLSARLWISYKPRLLHLDVTI